MGPAYYVRRDPPRPGLGRQDLAGRPDVTTATCSASTSVRSPGYTAQMDTDNARSGFHRSIVLADGLAARRASSAGAFASPGGTAGFRRSSRLAVRSRDRLPAPEPDSSPPTAERLDESRLPPLDRADPSVLPSRDAWSVSTWDPLDGATRSPGHRRTPGLRPPPRRPQRRAPRPGRARRPRRRPRSTLRRCPRRPGEVVAPSPATVDRAPT